MTKKRFTQRKVFFLNPRTCGVHKNGGARYKVDEHGRRTTDVDNELLEQVEAFITGSDPDGMAIVSATRTLWDVLVPRYFDTRWDAPFNAEMQAHGFSAVTIGELLDEGVLRVRGGHGSPGNDQRVGDVPYVKVSDIRNLRININPTNLIPMHLAKKLWRSPLGSSGLQAWDLISPNRASSNIGEFAILLPGEEGVVLTKEVFVLRVTEDAEAGWDPFYLLWALCLKSVRLQWQRVTLMQTNREDVGDRFREIRLPRPISKEWAQEVSLPFRTYFTTIAESRQAFQRSISSDNFAYIASILSDRPVETPEDSMEAPESVVEPQLGEMVDELLG